MTVQLCLAPHRDNPPPALGGLRLCAGHMAALEDALTGPSAHDDPTIDCVWGVRDWTSPNIAVHDSASRAAEALRIAKGQRDMREKYLHDHGLPPRSFWNPLLMCGDGETWHDPHDYRPGGLTRDWLALQRRGSSIATGEQAPYVSHSSENPLPIDGRLAQLRHDIPAVLRAWASVHVETFNATPPAGDTVAQLVSFLAVYRDAAAERDWAGDYVSELAMLRARARRLIDLPAPPRTIIGPCPERTEGQPCPGVLYSDIREERDPRPSEVRCDTCGAAWDSTQWMRLGQRLTHHTRRSAA